MKKLVFLLTIVFSLFLFGAGKVQAQSCVGTYTCCFQEEINSSCFTSCMEEPGATVSQCNAQCTVCTSSQSGFSCASGGAGCGAYDCGGSGWVTGGNCQLSSPPPPVNPTPPPGEPSPCWCTGEATCAASGGSWGGTGNGYCSGGLQCCAVGGGGGGGWGGCEFRPNDPPGCAGAGQGLPYPPGHCVGNGFQCYWDSNCDSGQGPCQWSQECCAGLTLQGDNICNCPVCTPSCSPACGQPDGCGGICGTSGYTAPGSIATTTPPNGGEVVVPVGGTQATISWSAASGANKYDLLLYPQDNPTCADPRAYCTQTISGGGLSTNSYTFVPQATAYYFYVRGVNTTCSAVGATGPWTSLIGFTIDGQITGTVYSDPNGQAALSGTLCQPFGGPNTPILPGAGSTVTTQDVLGVNPAVSVTAGGTYSTSGLFGSATTVTLSPGDASYACTCPADCVYGGQLPPKGGVNFYVSQIGGSWFQSMGGDTNASSKGANTFTDPINAFCVSPLCEPYPMLPPVGGTLGQVGALFSAGTSIDVSDQSGPQNSPVGPVGGDYPVKTTDSIACRENYDYFYRLYSMGTTPLEDFTAPQNNPLTAHKPDVAPLNLNVDGTSKAAYYRGGDLTIEDDWTLASGESFVIFVNGDLNITNGASITMPTDAFIAFLVSGSINIDPSIGTTDPTSTTGTIQGVYIATQNLTVESIGPSPASAEKKFVGEGTFVACGDIDLPRDYRNSPDPTDGLNNNRYPSSLFIFRPDIIHNTPAKMKRPIMNWREVAP